MLSIASEHKFCQINPRYNCRNSHHFIELSLRKGYEIKCRRPRCSRKCNLNWRNQLERCLSRLLACYLPSECQTYRGNLIMPQDATPDQHIKVRKAFRQILDRWKARTGKTLEMFGILDITDAKNAHWDTIAYSNASPTTLRQVIADALKRAGGDHQSLIPTTVDESQAHCRYVAKTRKVDQITHRHRYIPAERSANGLENVWHTHGFWQGKSVDALWSELVQEWFPKTSGSNKEDTLLASSTTPVFDPGNPQTFAVESKDKVEFKQQMLKKLAALDPNPVRDRSTLLQTLARSPEMALGSIQIAQRHGWEVAYTHGLLESLRGTMGVAQTNGQMIDGRACFNGWWRQVSN